jgi:hypothetical protein
MNAGLLILVWECITVVVGTMTKAMNPTFALYELLVQAVIVFPFAILATYWIDRKLLSPRAPSVGRLPQMPVPTMHQESLCALERPKAPPQQVSRQQSRVLTAAPKAVPQYAMPIIATHWPTADRSMGKNLYQAPLQR